MAPRGGIEAWLCPLPASSTLIVELRRRNSRREVPGDGQEGRCAGALAFRRMGKRPGRASCFRVDPPPGSSHPSSALGPSATPGQETDGAEAREHLDPSRRFRDYTDACHGLADVDGAIHVIGPDREIGKIDRDSIRGYARGLVRVGDLLVQANS